MVEGTHEAHEDHGQAIVVSHQKVDKTERERETSSRFVLSLYANAAVRG